MVATEALPIPQQVANDVREHMSLKDSASRNMGMRVVAIAPGHAVVTMIVREDMLNGHGTCHGGLIAALADSAFAFACNSYNEFTVASSFSIDLLAPAHRGDKLTATCAEVSKAGRNGVYDAAVTNEQGGKVAVFRGRSHTIKGKPAITA